MEEKKLRGIAAVLLSLYLALFITACGSSGSNDPDQYSITAMAGSNGIISPSGAVAVDNASDKMFTITPDSGYIVSDVLVDGVSVGAVTSYSFNNIKADHTIEVIFTNEPLTISATAGANGNISPSGDVSVDAGADEAFTITADAGYYVSDVLVDGVSVGAVESYPFTNVTSDHTIEAIFATGPRTITATAGANGNISPSGDVSVDPGTDQEFTITADANGYYVLDVLVDGVSVGAVTRYTFVNITTDHTIEASFDAGPRTITATAGANGSISPSGAVGVTDGTDQEFTITPDVDYYISDVLVDGVSVGAVTSYTFTNVTAAHTIEVIFATGPRTITATAGANGSISPSGDVSVDPGTDQEFTITPDVDYYISDVLVDGVSVGAVESYPFTNVTSDHTIEANFATNIIIATAGTNGNISPSGTVAVNNGANQSFTITPDTNHYVSEVLVDGISIGSVTGYTFIDVTSNHTIEASFEEDHIFVTIGDAITGGSIDDEPSDDTSQDGRNTGGGYQPILNDLLTAYENGIPHNIINAGGGGDTSADGLAALPTTLALYPEAQRYLVMYGTIDARPWAPVPSGKGLNPGHPGYPGTFKDSMQQIADAINNAGKEVILAKPPITLGDSTDTEPYPDPDTGARSVLIKEYNQVIDELVSDPLNNITVTPPDFYNYFKGIDPATGSPRYEDQYFDNLHPNGIGFQSMAEFWFNTLTQ